MELDFGTQISAKEFQINSQRGIAVYNNGVRLEPVDVQLDTAYERSKGAKIINRISLDPRYPMLHPNVSLTRFDRLFAIDTNTKILCGERVSVSCLIECLFEDNGSSFYATSVPQTMREFWNCINQPEKYGWRSFIESIAQDLEKTPVNSVGIIVDADLENIQRYNRGELSIYENFFLPKGFQLLYASADVGKEYLANQLVSICDKLAGTLLKSLETASDIRKELTEVTDPLISHGRAWFPIDESKWRAHGLVCTY